MHRAGIVQRFIGHAAGHRAVANNRNGFVARSLQVAADRKTERRRDRRRGMCGAKGVVFAFGPLGETGQPVTLAQGSDTVAAPRENLVRVDLMADIPDNLVIRCIEQIMQRNGQFDHAEPSAEMAAGHRHGIDRFGAQFISDLL